MFSRQRSISASFDSFFSLTRCLPYVDAASRLCVFSLLQLRSRSLARSGCLCLSLRLSSPISLSPSRYSKPLFLPPPASFLSFNHCHHPHDSFPFLFFLLLLLLIHLPRPSSPLTAYPSTSLLLPGSFVTVASYSCPVPTSGFHFRSINLSKSDGSSHPYPSPYPCPCPSPSTVSVPLYPGP